MANQSHDKSSNLTSLINIIGKRDVLEAEILNLLAELKKQNVTLTEPLVDEEGYPRSDVDVAAIRHIRHEIICNYNYF
ncbi:ATP-dependent DNA helicase [Caerostris extrusa]|uniref:ATP-dependent DNA helicase n=1 Tax=Caerostris extrusa TaxID=172846 RepID=A0AAV4UAJ7_CAEEX|nr:ATP-dependent DNA helicase [Caerostris extrusa]